MDYSEFLDYIENSELKDEEIYTSLVKQYGKNIIDKFYEEYLHDPEIRNRDKYSKLYYYLSLKEQEEPKKRKNQAELYSEDADRQYRKQLEYLNNKVPNEVRKRNIKKLTFLKLKKNGDFDFIINKFKKDLFSIGYNIVSINDYTYFDKVLRKIEKRLTKVPKNKKINEIIDDIHSYFEWKDLEYDEKLENEVYEQNLFLVVSAVKAMLRRKNRQNDSNSIGILDQLDLISEGNIGFKKGLEKFDPTRGAMSTCVYNYISQAITRSIENNSRTIRIPSNEVTKKNKIERVRQELSNKLGRTPTNEELAQKLNMKVETIEKFEEWFLQPVSIYKTLGDDDENVELIDLIADEINRYGIEDNVINLDNINTLRKLMQMAELKPKAILVLVLRNGLRPRDYLTRKDFYDLMPDNFTVYELEKRYNEYGLYTLDKVSYLIGMTKEGVRRKQADATSKLKEASKKMETFDDKLRKEVLSDDERINNNYAVLAEFTSTTSNTLSKEEVEKLIEELLTYYILLRNKAMSRNNIKYGIETSGYGEEFGFDTELLRKAAEHFEDDNYRKSLYNKLKIYLGYETIVETLMKNYSYILSKELRDLTFDNEILKHIDILEIVEYGKLVLRTGIEKYKLEKGDFEQYLSRYTRTAMKNYFNDTLNLKEQIKEMKKQKTKSR